MQHIPLIKHHLGYAIITLPSNNIQAILIGGIVMLLLIIIVISIYLHQINKKLQYQINQSNHSIIEREQLKSEIKERTEHLELAIQKSEEANRLKSLFLANMSHEIRTPLNGIMGFTELIIEENVSPSSQKLYAKYITLNSQNLLKLIDQIFHLSIIETGKVRINKERFNITELIRKIEEETLTKIQQSNKQIRLSINIENQDYIINTDKEKLKLILDNLFDNAIKFTKKGIIELTCLRMEKDFLFQLSDSGSGIQEDEFEFIFDPFTQGNETLRKIKGGSGLGLSNVKNYVILLGGKVWCEKNKPNGSIFNFTIPAPLLVENEILKMLNIYSRQN
ncbi:MAG: sensor histidine kinase [Prolixibacteraceae bacterium]